MSIENDVKSSDHFLAIKKTMALERKKDFVRNFTSNKSLLIGSIIVLFFVIVALAAPLIAPYDPLEGKSVNRYQSPNSTNLFGTDEFGRDVFSRVVYGSQISLLVGFSVAITTSIIGMVIGLYSAYYRKLDNIFMRINDGVMSFPEILLAIAIMAALGASISNVIIATSIVYIPHVTRVVRAKALVVREETYIEAMKALGAKPARIIWLHIAPNCISPLIVQATFIFALSILIEAALSFLGAGTPLPTASLGNIISDGKVVLNEAWWMTIFPGVFIILIVLGLNLLGDGLSDLLNPRSNKNSK